MSYINNHDDPAFVARSSLRYGLFGVIFFGFIFGVFAIKDGLKSKRLGYKGIKPNIGIILGAYSIVSWLYWLCLLIQKII